MDFSLLRDIADKLRAANIPVEYREAADGDWLSIPTGVQQAIEIEMHGDPDSGEHVAIGGILIPQPVFSIVARTWDETHALASEKELGIADAISAVSVVRALVLQYYRDQEANEHSMGICSADCSLCVTTTAAELDRDAAEFLIETLDRAARLNELGSPGASPIQDLFDAIDPLLTPDVNKLRISAVGRQEEERSMESAVDKIWGELVGAELSRYRRAGSTLERMQRSVRASTLLDVYCQLAGEDAEAAHERLMNVVQARAEGAAAASDDLS